MSRSPSNLPRAASREFQLRPLALALQATMVGVTLGVIALPMAAQAQTPAALQSVRKTFDIRPGPLEPALKRFAQLSGVDLAYDGATVAGAQTRGLNGSLGIAAGLDALLAGSGVSAAAQPGGGYVLRRAPAQGTDANTGTGTGATLPAITVSEGVDRSDFFTAKSSVGARVATDQHDIAQAVTVVNQALLQSQAATSFQDALRNVPGVTIGAAEGGVIGNNINLRGFTANNDIYLDGFRDRGQYYRDTFDLESIDVLYGPSSLYFGRGSTGGAINQVSKKANLTPSAEASVTVGTHDRYRSTVDINQPLSDTSAFRLNAFGQDQHSTRDLLNNQDYGVAPTLSLGIGTPTEITLSALIQHNNDQPDYGIQSYNGRPAPVPRGTLYGYSDDRTIQDVQTFSARIVHHFGDGVTLRNQTQFNHAGTDAREDSLKRGLFTGPSPRSPALGAGNVTALPPESLFVGLVTRDRAINNHSIYNSTDVQASFGSGDIKHDIVAGVDLGHETYSNQGYQSTSPGLPTGMLAIVPLVAPPEGPRPTNVAVSLDNRAESSADSVGIYANDTVSLGRHWKLVGGVRWDRYSASIANSTGAPAYAKQTTDFTSVRAGVIYQPADWQSYYISYGTSFNPSLEALTLTSGQQDLEPEHNRSIEIGSKWDLLDGDLSVTQSLFQIEKTNARTLGSDGLYTLDGDVRVRGYQIGAAGRLSKKWQLYGGYTYLDSRIMQAADGTQGNLLANTPRNMLTLWSTYSITPQWQIGGGPVYQSSRYAANDNVVSVPSYVRWDAMVTYHTKRYDIRLNLINLTNKYYYDALIASDGGRAVPALGRTVLATFDYRF